MSRKNLGDALRTSGGITEALDLYRKALDTHRTFRTQDPRNVRATCDVARLAETIGDVLSSAEAPGACAAWRESQSARQDAGSTAACAALDEMTRLSLKLGGC